MKLWIDDVRLPPNEDWIWATTSQEAIEWLDLWFTHSPKLQLEVSFDHDLGGDDTTIPVVKFLERQAALGDKDFTLVAHVHSANPVGRKNLNLALDSIERFNSNR